MGSKKETTNVTNQTQTAAPPSWTMPGISNAAAKVTEALNGLPGVKYTGDIVAQPNYDPAIEAYRGAAGKAGELAAFTQGQLGGFMAPGAGPAFSTDLTGTRVGTQGLDAAITAAINPVFKQLTQQVLPGIRSSALDSGAYSGDRAMSVLPTQAIAAGTESAQRIAAELGYQNVQADADRALAAYGADTSRGLGVEQAAQGRMAQLPDLVDTVMRLTGGQGDILSQVAQMQQQQQQAGIDNAMARNDYDYQFPFRGLDIASSLLAQLSGNYGTTTGISNSKTTEKTGGLGSIVQGIAGLAGMIGGLPMGGGTSLIGSLFKKTPTPNAHT